MGWLGSTWAITYWVPYGKSMLIYGQSAFVDKLEKGWRIYGKSSENLSIHGG